MHQMLAQGLDHEPFSPAALAEDLAGICAAPLAARGLDFQLDLADNLPGTVAGAVGTLRQIILQLLHNAGEFTQIGRVRLSMAAAPGGGLFVAVSDTGCGIPRHRKDDIFASSPPSRHANPGSSLAICRRLVELMGGRIGVDSEAGAGTTIWFEVPLPAATRPPPPAIPAGLESLMPAFVAEMAKDGARLREIGTADRALLAEQAHATRGKCGMFGETILFDLLTRLEAGAAELDEGEISALLAAIVERAAQLTEYEASSMIAAP